ncbi:MAG: exopolysaccharide biosynthesis protein [Bacilli bacterium]|nr:exopolysaccharide biosynthesis protein [Bacilli bacterium]
MTDVHSHILFGIDDGSRTISESIELLKKLKSVGFNNVILTPHFILDSTYNSNYEANIKIYNELKERLLNENIDINIYLGNEIFIDKNVPTLLEKNIITSLNGTKYVLVEFPMHNKLLNIEDILYEIRSKGYEVVIAHPERYDAFKEDYSIVDTLREDGFLFQSNYSSILGYYGKDSIKLLKYMLKRHYIDFLGTDIHRIEKTYVIDNFKKIEKHIIKVTGSEYYNKIQLNNNKLV